MRGLVDAEYCIPTAAGLLCLNLCWPTLLLGTAEAVIRHSNLPPLCKSNTLLRTEGSMGSGGRAKILVLGPASRASA